MSADQLRRLLSGDAVVHAPGVVDAVSAAQVRRAGFSVAYLSGAVTSAAVLGRPDLGFVHGSDIAGLAGRLRPALGDLPLVADADTGYGNAVHARHTAEAYARAGIAGLHIEDQVAPKRCGHMAGKAVVDRAEAVARVRAAAEADADIVVIARTDASGVHGLDEAVARAAEFAAAGADLVFAEGVTDPAELSRVAAAAGNVGLVLNRSEAGGDGVVVDDSTLFECGVRLVIHPVAALLAAAAAVRQVYDAIAANGAATGVERMSWQQLTDTIGLPEQLALEAKYA